MAPHFKARDLLLWDGNLQLLASLSNTSRLSSHPCVSAAPWFSFPLLIALSILSPFLSLFSHLGLELRALANSVLALGGFLKLLPLDIRDSRCLAVALLCESKLDSGHWCHHYCFPRRSSGFLLALCSASPACDREHQLINHSRKDSVVLNGTSVVVDDIGTSQTKHKVAANNLLL